MVTINSVTINSNYSIVVDVSTTVGHHITKVLLWTMDTFKDYSKALDFSFLLDGTTNQENFFITANQIDPDSNSLGGIFFLEFTSDEDPFECLDNSNMNVAVVANTVPYQECLLNKVLSTQIAACDEKQDECIECQEKSQDVRYVSTLLRTLDIAIRFGYLEETIKIFKELNKVCEICHDCPDFGSTDLVAGYGYGTVDNSIILV